MVATEPLATDRPTGPTKPEVDPLAETVKTRWTQGSEALSEARRRYWIDLAFFAGDQWVHWDPVRRVVDRIDTSKSVWGLPGRSRLVINRIGPNCISLISRLMHSDLAFEVMPSGGGDDVVTGARLAEAVLSDVHREQSWETVRFDALFSALLGGCSAVAFEWDGKGGETLEWDAETGNIIGTGDVRLEPLNISEFCIEPGVRRWRDATWWIMGVAMSPLQARERYGLSWTPIADAKTLNDSLKGKLMRESGRSSGDQVLVLTMYERPTAANRNKGRCVTVINGQAVVDDAWPFPFSELNLAVFRQQAIPSQWLGRTMMEDAVPIQLAYNYARSLINDHLKLAGNARMTVPYGSVDEEAITNDPGSILWYSPDVGGSRPEYLMPPQLPRWQMQHISDLARELDDIMYVHATTRGEATIDRGSGQAYALLAEKDDTPLGPMARDQAQGWSHLARLALLCYESKVTETRTARARGPQNTPMTSRWNGSSLREQHRVHVPLEITQPRSRAAQAAFVKDLWDRQIITDPRLYSKLLGMAESEFEEMLDADAAKATRENARMLDGMVEIPAPFDNHAVHIAEHNRTRKSDSYLYADDDVQALIDDHIKFHEQMAVEEQTEQMTKEMVMPGLSAAPQAHEPEGSMVPQDYAEQMAQMVPGAQQNPAQMPGFTPPTTPQGAPAGSVGMEGM